jgi:hypothetical protein
MLVISERTIAGPVLRAVHCAPPSPIRLITLANALPATRRRELISAMPCLKSPQIYVSCVQPRIRPRLYPQFLPLSFQQQNQLLPPLLHQPSIIAMAARTTAGPLSMVQVRRRALPPQATTIPVSAPLATSRIRYTSAMRFRCSAKLRDMSAWPLSLPLLPQQLSRQPITVMPAPTTAGPTPVVELLQHAPLLQATTTRARAQQAILSPKPISATRFQSWPRRRATSASRQSHQLYRPPNRPQLLYMLVVSERTIAGAVMKPVHRAPPSSIRMITLANARPATRRQELISAMPCLHSPRLSPTFAK